MQIKTFLSQNPALSLLSHSSGTIYHQTGLVGIVKDKMRYLPVNRSYVLSDIGDRTNNRGSYIKSKIIHDEPGDQTPLLTDERIFVIWGKKYLFIDSQKCNVTYSTKIPNNSKYLGKLILNLPDLKNLVTNKVKLGISGSYLAGLESTDSDLDLIIWCPVESRNDVWNNVDSIFAKEGFSKTSLRHQNQKYIDRYSHRFNVPTKAAKYIADKRMRWVDDSSRAISLQIMSDKVNTRYVENAIINGIHFSHIKPVELNCKVIYQRNSFELQKNWIIEVEGQLFDLISLSWMHQGMGTGFANVEFTLRANRISTQNKTFFVMTGSEHFLLPKQLLSTNTKNSD